MIAYSLIYGIIVAVALIILLIMHEGFHGVAMKAFGYRVSKIVLVPFIGAAIVPGNSFKKSFHEAIIALAGPTISLIVFLIIIEILWTVEVKSKLLITICYVGVLLNLFNLLPMLPLDGGRVISSTLFTGGFISRIVIGFISIVTLIVAGGFLKISPVIVAICILGIVELMFKKQETMRLSSRALVLSLYILTIMLGTYELIKVEERLGVSIQEVLKD